MAIFAVVCVVAGCGSSGIGSGQNALCSDGFVACGGDFMGTWVATNTCMTEEPTDCIDSMEIKQTPTIELVFNEDTTYKSSIVGKAVISLGMNLSCTGAGQCSDLSIEEVGFRAPLTNSTRVAARRQLSPTTTKRAPCCGRERS